MLKDECGMLRNNQPQTTNDTRRTLIGILAVFFLLGALACWIWPPTQGVGLEWESACWRFAPILAVLWLAYPELKRVPWWLWLVLPVALVIIVKWPKTFLLSIPFLVLVVLLKVQWTRR
jgi:hypothetical protein